MPRVKTAQDRREDAMLGAIGRCRGMLRLRSDEETATKAGMKPRRYGYAKSLKFQNLTVAEFGGMARGLGITGRELCQIFGVGYKEDEE